MESQNSEYILVPGGLGYIGAHTVVELVKSHNEKVVIIDNLENTSIICLDRINQITGMPDNIVFVEVDIRNYEEMEEKVFKQYSIKSVIHFAAFKSVGESVAKPLEYYSNNVQGSITLMRLLQKFGVKCMVFSSSCTVYGQNAKAQEGDRI